jgi:hypothetical protein
MFLWSSRLKLSTFNTFIRYDKLDKFMHVLRHKNKDNKCKAVYGEDKRQIQNQAHEPQLKRVRDSIKYSCLESDSLGWPLLTWYPETRSSKDRNFDYNWYSSLLDSHFFIRWFSKYWPHPLSLRPIAVFRHFFFDATNWPFSWPFRAFQGTFFFS